MTLFQKLETEKKIEEKKFSRLSRGYYAVYWIRPKWFQLRLKIYVIKTTKEQINLQTVNSFCC